MGRLLLYSFIINPTTYTHSSGGNISPSLSLFLLTLSPLVTYCPSHLHDLLEEERYFLVEKSTKGGTYTLSKKKNSVNIQPFC